MAGNVNEKYLKLLECEPYSSLDDIKVSYRKLSMLHHPDITGSGDSSIFRALTQAYEFLKINHSPRPKPKDIKGLQKFFRYFSDSDSELSTTLPVESIEEDTVLICMWKGREFNVHLEAGKTLPLTLDIKNVLRHPVRMTIRYDSYL